MIFLSLLQNELKEKFDMRSLKGILAGLVAVGCAAGVQAEVKLASLFTDNLVLQRDMPVPVWGKADPGEAVAVIFGKQSKDVKAGADGKWMVKLDPLKASSEPSDLIVKGSNEIVLKNVLVGEVWVCSGQSNMEMSVKSSKDSEKEIADGKHPQIRAFVVAKAAEKDLQDSFSGKWTVCSPETVGGYSAAGYFFGREINDRLDVPVGLLMTYWGGTPAQAWTELSYLKGDEDFAGYLAEYERDSALSKIDFEKIGKQRKEIEAEMQKRVDDPGNKGELDGWQNPGIDLSSWEKVKVPTGWFTDKNIYGAIWYRRDIEVPAEWAGKDLVLNIGVIDDFDTTYFNGEKVGAIGKETDSWWTVSRQYKIPGKSVKAGLNTVAVRVFNDFSGGGFCSAPDRINLALADSSASLKLAGEWLRKIEVAVKTFPQLPRMQNSPSFLYNAMIAPAIPYAIRGAIWYQGESNAGRAYEYRKLFPTMIKSWRDNWGQGDFPFYFVQLANFMAVKDSPGESSWAELREAQSLTLSNSFNTGMAVIIDIGEAKDIHPKNKQDVGKRLAFSALSNTYGKSVESSGPVCRAMKYENGAIRLFFDHVGDGLEAKGGDPLTGFAICGADRKFVWAKADISGDSVIVSSPDVKEPIAVRYAWADNPVCNLYNEEGLPASPFRTDSFPGVTQPKK